jgi:hypothetical protein
VPSPPMTTASSHPSHYEAVRVAIDDTRAFLDREGAVHPARDLSGHSKR